MKFTRTKLFILSFLVLNISSAQIFLEQPIPRTDVFTSQQTKIYKIDFDSDGDMDVFFGGSIPDSRVFINEGGNMDSVYQFYTYPSAPDRFEVADLNNDGLDDIIVHDQNFLYIHHNLGDGDYDFIDLTQNFGTPLDLTVGDIDDDGLNDIIVSYYQNSGRHIRWAKNLGSMSFEVLEILIDGTEISGANLGDGVRFLKAIDMEGDGDVDLFLHNVNSAIAINDGNGNFSVGGNSLSLLWKFAFGDIDDDGDIDIANSEDYSGEVLLYINNGSNGFASFLQDDYIDPANNRNGDLFRHNAVNFIDFDEDGDLDLAMSETYATTGGGTRFFTNNGTSTFEKFQLDTDTILSYTNFSYAHKDGAEQFISHDFDQDGDTDIITASDRDYNVSYHRQNPDNTYESQVINIALRDVSRIQYIDLNKDGLKDLITHDMHTYSGKVLVNYGLGNGAFTKRPEYLQVGINDFSRGSLIEDFDGDGTWDMLIANANVLKLTYDFMGTSSTSYPFESNNYDPSNSQKGVIGSGVETSTPTLTAADIDNDGDLDILVADQNGGSSTDAMRWLKNNGDQTYTMHVVTIIGVSLTSYALGDVTGDEKLEFVFTEKIDNSSSTFQILELGANDENFASYYSDIIPFDGRVVQQILVEDGDNDQVNDIIFNGLNWIKNNGDDTYGDFTSLFAAGGTTSTFGGVGPPKVKSGDLNGDGLIDFVGNTYSSGFKLFTAINLGAGNFKLSEPIEYQPVEGGFELVDINEDGLDDILIGDQLVSGNGGSYALNAFVTSLKSRQTIDFSTITANVYGTTTSLNATVDSGLSFTYESSDESIISISGNEYSVVGVGEVTITAKQAGNEDFIPAEESQTVTTGKANLTIKADDLTKIYGEEVPEFTASFTGFKFDDDETEVIGLTLTSSATQTSDAALYTITAADATAENYNITFQNGGLTIDRATLSVIADSKTKVYGDENPVLTISYEGFLNGDSEADITPPTILTAATESSVVGDYTIYFQSVNPSTNYLLSTTEGTLEVTKAPLTAVISDATKVYGAENPTFEVVYSGFKNGEDGSVIQSGPTTEAHETSGVGSYDITVSEVEADNYEISGEVATLTITPAMLTAVAEDQTKIYGEDNPDLTIQYAGLVNEDDESSITPPTVSTSATNLSAVGDYDIVLSGGAADNYSITTNNGILTINKASLSVVISDASKVYGDDLPDFAATYTGFVNNDDETLLGGVTTDAVAGSDVGTYDIALLNSTTENYAVSANVGALTITPADLTITADDKVRVYGEQNPEFTFDLFGLVNGDSEADIILLTLSTTATETSDVGTYAIEVSGGSNANYNFINTNGTLTITQAPLDATIGNATKSYGEVNPTFEVDYNGFVNGDNAAALNLAPETSANEASPVGSYDVRLASSGLVNYSLTSNTAILTITPADLTITADDKTKTYGQANPELTISYDGFENGEGEANITAPSISTSATASTVVGAYDIILSGGSADNYAITLTDGTLTVNKATLTVEADDKTINKGDDLPELTYAYAGFVNGEDESTLDDVPSISTTATASSDRGEYPISLSGGSGVNYELSLQEGVLTITGPVYDLPNAISFLETLVGETSIQKLTIANTGDGQLSVSEIALPEGFTVSDNLFTLEAGSSIDLDITFTPTEEKAYSGDLVITSNNGVEFVSVAGEGTVEEALGAESLTETVSIYPNPTTQFLSVDISNTAEEILKVRVVDMSGTEIFNTIKPDGSLTINLAGFTKGVYFLFMETEEGSVSEKIILK
ncbi:MAG: MBG domain-containing protein [Cyclobacteriaceae bacterium]